MNKTLIIVENHNDLRDISEIIQDKMGRLNSFTQNTTDIRIKNENSYVLITHKEEGIREYNFNNVVDLRHSTLVKEWFSDKILELAKNISI